jgi:AcrR family transcriptional regulator
VAANRRGRPVEVDPDQVARLALRLFVERGFDAVTMDDIAQAAQVSRRSLFRLFSTKSTLLWEGLPEAVEEFGQALADQPPETDAFVAVREAVTGSLLWASPDIEITRARLRLIGAHSALFAEVIPRFERGQRQIAAFLAERRPDLAGLVATVAASAITATVFTALTWWAEHDDGPPQPVVDRALRTIEEGFSPQRSRSSVPRT